MTKLDNIEQSLTFLTKKYDELVEKVESKRLQMKTSQKRTDI